MRDLSKISFKVNNKDNDYQKKFLLFFENISYNTDENTTRYNIFSQNIDKDLFFLNQINANLKYDIEVIKNLDWHLYEKKNDVKIETEFFFFHQGLSEGLTNRKKLIIPAGLAFGTGGHESTILAVRMLEQLLKRYKFYFSLDVGTGTGILSFVLYCMIRKKVFSTDICKKSQKVFSRNKKINNLNNLFFIRCFGTKCIILKRKKFDLIVANLLMNEHKRVMKDILKQLKKNGMLVISGILKSQANYFIILLKKLNFRFIKSLGSKGWVSIAFIKY